MTAEQVQQLFDSSENDCHHALWVLLATTGLRLGEATALMWADIDFAGSRLVVQRTLQRQIGIGLVLVEPKTQASRRTIHMARKTLMALRAHKHMQAEERLKAGPLWEDRGLVFCTPTGKPLDPGTVDKFFHSALKRAGLPILRVHDLRHTAATLLLAQGVHPRVVQELLGHATITLTLGTYSHVTPALHVEVAKRMDSLFNS